MGDVRGAIAILGLTACGRIEFAPLDDAGRDVAVDMMSLECVPPPCAGAATARLCGDRCFAACAEIVMAVDSAPRCTAWGGTLAVMRYQADVDCVTGLSSSQLWMGYFQIVNAATPAAGWSWVDGDPSTFVNWAAGEPNDGATVESNTEQCGELYPDGSWNDEACGLFGEDGFACSR